MAKKLLTPEAVRDFLARRYRNQRRSWLAGGGVWPLSVSLGAPTEKEVADETGVVRNWVEAWHAWNGPADILWEWRQWPRLGKQRLPVSMVFSSPEAVTEIVGEARRWSVAVERYRRMTTRWPSLAHEPVLVSQFSVLADYPAGDFERLVTLLEWLERNPSSNLYLRQLPVPGLDTKWVEQRTGVVADLMRVLRHQPEESNFHALCGLRKPPDRIRLRVLCPELRRSVGGLNDIEAPVDELARLSFAPAACLIVENLATGLAVPDVPGIVCIMKLGNAVSLLGPLSWLQSTRVVYWGDIDTRGFAILDRARKVVPHLRSALMDEHTLLAHRTLCGTEESPHPVVDLPNLNTEELSVFHRLRSGVWGNQLRLEQERLPWDYVLAALTEALAD